MCKNIMEMHRFLIANQPGETQTVIKDLIFHILKEWYALLYTF